MRKFSILMISVAALAIVAAGCGGGGKKSVTIGDTKYTAGGSLPSDFPKDFPVYSGADLKGSISTSQQGQKGAAVTWESGDSVDKVKAYYKDKLSGSGDWVQDSAADTGDGAYYSFHHKNGDSKAGFLTIVKADSKTDFIVFLGDNPDAARSQSGSSDATTSAGDDKTATADAKTAEADGASSSNDTPTPADLPPAATIAKDFPKDRVPFPSGARVTSSTSLNTGGVSTFYAEVYVKDSADKVSSYFKDELPKHNWTNALTSEANGAFFLTFTGTSSETVTISIEDSDTPGYAKVSLAVSVTA